MNTDLVPYEPPRDELAFPESPSPKWRVIKCEPVHQTGRWHKNSYQMLNLVLEHEKGNGEFVTVDVMVDRSWKLANLKPFLDSAENLPDGIRIKVFTAERVPWDKRPDRRPRR